MSIKIMSWVMDHSPYSGKARLVHLVLADHANDEGVCWPSQERIAARAGCTVEHVRLTVKRMVSDGYVQIVQESRGPGSSHRYMLKNPKSVGVSDHGIPQIDRPNTPNPQGDNHKESSKEESVVCSYCYKTFIWGKPHDCPATNMRM